jgi:hypothetical protein
MLIPGKSERQPRFYYPKLALELLARQFTSIAVITSWDFEHFISNCELDTRMFLIIGAHLKRCIAVRAFPTTCKN